jgi:geranylgeranyl diphosphate synthase type I
MQNFAPSLDELRRAVDAELRSFLVDRRNVLPEADLMIDEISRLVEAGGKRLRPSFCYWGFRAAGAEPSDAIIRAAASLELLHTFAIVHDDIMDRSDERRGEPTVHVKHGSEVALLVGDLSLVLADHLFFDSGFEPDILQAAFRAYSRMRQEVIAGQFLDVRSGAAPEVGVELARRIAVLKSGRYSIAEPLVIGALLAGAGAALVRRLSEVGEPLGEAFQLRDDLLGLFGDRTSIGKSTDSDIREGKRHLLFAFAVETLRSEEREFFLRRWGAGSSLDDDEVEKLRSLVVSSGARERVETHLAELEREAAALLERLEIPVEAKAALVLLSARATHRST